MGFFDIFIKDIETSDKHRFSELRTHYYRCDYRIAKDAVERFLNQKKYKVSSVNDNYGEIFVENSSFHMIISLRKSAVINISVDIKVRVYGIIGAYKPHKLIKEIYTYLDKQLPFIGIGLQPGV